MNAVATKCEAHVSKSLQHVSKSESQFLNERISEWHSESTTVYTNKIRGVVKALFFF